MMVQRVRITTIIRVRLDGERLLMQNIWVNEQREGAAFWLLCERYPNVGEVPRFVGNHRTCHYTHGLMLYHMQTIPNFLS